MVMHYYGMHDQQVMQIQNEIMFIFSHGWICIQFLYALIYVMYWLLSQYYIGLISFFRAIDFVCDTCTHILCVY